MPDAPAAVTRLVFLAPASPTAWDVRAWRLAELSERGLDVVVADLGAVVQPGAPVREAIEGPWSTVRVESRREFRALVRDLAPGAVFLDFLVGVSDVGPREAFVFSALKRAGAPYVLVYAGAVPPALALAGLPRGTRTLSIGRVAAAAARRVMRGLRRAGLYLALPRRVYASRAESVEGFLARFPSLAGARRPINSFDFDRYLDLLAAGPLPERDGTCLFLDEGLLGHPDFAYLGVGAVDAGEYATDMRRVFDAVESATGLKVRVAAHPRVDPAAVREAFAGREVVQGETPELVARADAVIAHWSTAVSFAALFDRPLLLCETAGMRTNGFAGQVRGTAAAFGLTAFDASDAAALAALPGDPARWPRPDHAGYLARYVRDPDAPALNTWEIVAADLERGL